MLKDKVMVGVLIGILADAVKLIFNYLAFLFGFTNVVFWQIVATRFLEKDALYKPVAYLIGGAADLTVTAGLGVLFFFTIHYIAGRNFLWVKGIGFGMFVWIALFSTLLGETVQAKLPQNASGILVTLTAHFIFGIGLAFFTSIFYKVIEESEPERKKENFFRVVAVPAKKVLDTDAELDKSKVPHELKSRKPVKLKSLKNLIKIKKSTD